MDIHFRHTSAAALIGVLALGGASVARAQDTSAAAHRDTAGYQPSPTQTDTMQAGQNAARSDSSGYQSNGASSDTALHAAPGVQTGPTARDTGRMGSAQDTSSYQQDTSGYKSSSSQTDTTGQTVNRSSSGYNYHGAPTDTTLKAEPGVQTGPSTGDSGRVHHRRHMRMSAMDTVVCKDGSNSANSARGACGSHGGVDTAATWAAMKARGSWKGQSGHGTSSDTSASTHIRSSSDTSASNRSNSSSDTSSSSTHPSP